MKVSERSNNMEMFIILFIPSMLSIRVYTVINNKKCEMLDLVILYFEYVLFNYILSLIFSIIFFDLDIGLTKAMNDYYIFSIKYLTVAFGFAIIMPFLFKFVKENIKLKLEKCKNE